MIIIHRRSMNGGIRCGATSGKVSFYGAGVTCPKCVELDRGPTLEESMADLEAAAARFRESHPEWKETEP